MYHIVYLTRNKISNIHLGKTYSDKTKAKIGAASKGRIQAGAKHWVLLSPDGVEHRVYNLKGFCTELGINWKILSRSVFGLPISRGKAKGWIVVSCSR